MDPHDLVPDNFGELLKRIGDSEDDEPEALARPQTSRDDGAEAPQTDEKPRGDNLPLRYTVLHAGVQETSLAQFAAKYIKQEVFGIQAENTLSAKMRDLGGFIRWFVALNGHGEIRDWMPRDTMAYLLEVEKAGKRPATINRVFATLRHFARWVNEQPGAVFSTHGLPTRGVKELVIDEPDCKKLSKVEIHRLFRAADTLCVTETKGSQRPKRTRAIFAILYTTGLRVSELIALRREQYDGRYLRDVRRKGRGRTRGLYIVSETRQYLDEYIASERMQDDTESCYIPLFIANSTGGAMRRQRIRQGLVKLGQEAGKHSGEVIVVHPHRLRHTFGAEYRDKTGSDTETASALGHASLKYVGRYVRKTDAERESVMESIFSPSSKAQS